MKRLPVRKRIRLPLPVYNQGHAFFVTVATHTKHPWFLLHPELCRAAIKVMRDVAFAKGMTIYAWCIMPDHVHLLLQGLEIVEFVRLFKGKMTPIGRAIDPDRRLWQRSFYDHALRKEESLSEIACYIWENPVRAAMVEDATAYPWSGSGVWPEWREFYGRG